MSLARPGLLICCTLCMAATSGEELPSLALAMLGYDLGGAPVSFRCLTQPTSSERTAPAEEFQGQIGLGAQLWGIE